MSLDSAGGKLGSPISNEVYNQILLRSKVNKRSDLSVSIPSTFLETKLFNSAWITVVSSVDILKNNKIKFVGSELAKRFVLSGGSLLWDGKKFIRREGINFDNPIRKDTYDVSTSAYHGSNLGIRPMPGITSFQIKSKNLYGTLREAEIQFTVWSLDDLEMVEALYLRPGYHMVVEWGHSVGLDNSGKVVEIEPRVSTYADYFVEKPASRVYALINQNRKKFFYGYDGFLGIVKNFSWTIRPDGGYDCSISVISKGEVLESLSMRTGITTKTEPEGAGKNHQDICSTNLLTKFNCVCLTATLETYNEAVNRTKSFSQDLAEFVGNAADPTLGGFILNLFNFQAIADLVVNTTAAGKKKEEPGAESLYSLQNFENNILARDYYPEVIDVVREYSEEVTPYFGFIKFVEKDNTWWKNPFSDKTSQNFSYFSLGLILFLLHHA